MIEAVLLVIRGRLSSSVSVSESIHVFKYRFHGETWLFFFQDSLSHFQSFQQPPNPVIRVLSYAAASVSTIVFSVGGIFDVLCGIFGQEDFMQRHEHPDW